MKKYLMDLKVVGNERLNERHALLRLSPAEGTLPDMLPGQFVQVRIEDSPSTFLRRPISICDCRKEDNILTLLVQLRGEGTRHLGAMPVGRTVNTLLPLGKGFTPVGSGEDVLLVGGGVGVAPLLYLGASLKAAGARPHFLLGARSASDILLRAAFEALGPVYISTEDGSLGDKGFVTQHSVLASRQWKEIRTCGPKPMMMAVARYARQTGANLEVSLENMMACGLGACLCCVEDTSERGNVCVCKEGPVFNINELKWQI